MPEQSEREMEYQDLLERIRGELRSVLGERMIREEWGKRYQTVLSDTYKRVDDCLREE